MVSENAADKKKSLCQNCIKCDSNQKVLQCSSIALYLKHKLYTRGTAHRTQTMNIDKNQTREKEQNKNYWETQHRQKNSSS